MNELDLKPETWFERQKRLWKFMSRGNKFHLIRCFFGFHAKQSYYDVSCWACGKRYNK